MGEFRRSRFFGSLVEPRKAREGWLPRHKFDRLCRREYTAWRLWRRLRLIGLMILCFLGFWVLTTVSSFMNGYRQPLSAHTPHHHKRHMAKTHNIRESRSQNL